MKSNIKVDVKECNLKDELRLYIEANLPIFPVYEIGEGGKCTCSDPECGSAGKHPRTKNGMKDATSSQYIINEWYMRWPNANVAVATGTASGLVVLDVDPRHGGMGSLGKMMKKFGGLPISWQVSTGGGGYHYYFKIPQDIIIKSTTRLCGLDGLDIRGEGGYVLLPPSNHISGQKYRWEIPFENFWEFIPEIPAWLLELMLNPRKLLFDEEGKAKDTTIIKGPGWVAEALKELKDGNRNDSFARITGKLHRGGLEASEIITLLSPHAEKAQFSLDELGSEVKGICTRYPRTSIPQFNDIYNGSIEVLDASHVADFPEPNELPWIVDKLLPEKHSAILYSDGGIGKTWLGMHLAACAAQGKTFLDLPTKRTPVLYLDWELNREEHLRRSYQIARGMNLGQPPSDIYYVKVCSNISKVMGQIVKIVERYKIGLIVIDSLGLAGGVDPESAGQIIPLFLGISSLNTTILTLDHQSKLQEGQTYNKKTPFGSAYKYNLARSVFQLQKAVGASPEELHILMEQRKSNFGRGLDPIAIKMVFGDRRVQVDRIKLSDSPAWNNISTSRKVVETLRKTGPATKKQLAMQLGINEGTVGNTLCDLKKNGAVKEMGKDGNAPIYTAEPEISTNGQSETQNNG